MIFKFIGSLTIVLFSAALLFYSSEIKDLQKEMLNQNAKISECQTKIDTLHYEREQDVEAINNILLDHSLKITTFELVIRHLVQEEGLSDE